MTSGHVTIQPPAQGECFLWTSTTGKAAMLRDRGSFCPGREMGPTAQWRGATE